MACYNRFYLVYALKLLCTFPATTSFVLIINPIVKRANEASRLQEVDRPAQVV